MFVKVGIVLGCQLGFIGIWWEFGGFQWMVVGLRHLRSLRGSVRFRIRRGLVLLGFRVQGWCKRENLIDKSNRCPAWLILSQERCHRIADARCEESRLLQMNLRCCSSCLSSSNSSNLKWIMIEVKMVGTLNVPHEMIRKLALKHSCNYFH